MAGSGGRPENPEPAQGESCAVGVYWPSAGTAEVLRTVHRISMGMRKETPIFAISA